MDGATLLRKFAAKLLADPLATGKVHATVAIILDQNPETLWRFICGDSVEVKEGEGPHDARFALSSATFDKILNQGENPQKLWQEGHILVTGDNNAALKLSQLFA